MGRASGALLAGSALLAGCASAPEVLHNTTTPPSVLVAAADAGIRDLRGEYRAAVCSRIAADRRPCDELLLRLSGEPAAAGAPVPDAAARYRIAFVPGFFSECFDGLAQPFADVERSLRGAGFTVDYVRVSGRGTVAQNAARLSRYFDALERDGRRVIVFAYSKGLPDLLEFIVREPAAATRVAAVVSVAGAVNGSPLADDLQAVYRDWVAAFPLPGCDAGTGAEIADLRRDVRLEWWRRHGGDVGVPIFSIVAAPAPERVSPGTRASYRRLSRVDPRNDGKLLWQDQIAPKGYLLGYVNADHWAIAIPVAEELPGLAFLFRDEVPRPALVEAAIEVVARTLATAPGR